MYSDLKKSSIGRVGFVKASYSGDYGYRFMAQKYLHRLSLILRVEATMPTQNGCLPNPNQRVDLEEKPRCSLSREYNRMTSLP